MPIRKQEFYEGAALHLLTRGGSIERVRYSAPFFFLNDDVVVLLKYSTRGRSPWGFTFTPEEQVALRAQSDTYRVFVGLICGSDGVAGFSFDRLQEIAQVRPTALHVSCYRRHREHYEVNGPDGALSGKIAPSDWQRLLNANEVR